MNESVETAVTECDGCGKLKKCTKAPNHPNGWYGGYWCAECDKKLSDKTQLEAT